MSNIYMGQALLRSKRTFFVALGAAGLLVLLWVISDGRSLLLWLLLPVYVLSLILLLKVVAIWNALLWLRRYGSACRADLGGLSVVAVSAEVLARHGATFFPFGLKDFKLRIYIQESGGLRRSVVRSFQSILFRAARLMRITCIILFFVESILSWNERLLSMLGIRVRIFLLMAAALPLVANALLGFEFICSNLVFGGYALPFHGEDGHGEPRPLVELRQFLKQVITAMYAGATLAYVAYINYAALKGDISTIIIGNRYGEVLVNRTVVYLQCFYFCATTFTTVGYGDIVPANPIGQAIALLIMLQSFCLIVMVFASLMSVTSNAAPQKPPSDT